MSTTEKLFGGLAKSTDAAHLSAAELAALPGPNTERLRQQVDPRAGRPRQRELEQARAALAARRATLKADAAALGNADTERTR